MDCPQAVRQWRRLLQMPSIGGLPGLGGGIQPAHLVAAAEDSPSFWGSRNGRQVAPRSLFMWTHDYLVVGLPHKVELRPIGGGKTLCEGPLRQQQLY
jgi:hypothetical protein